MSNNAQALGWGPGWPNCQTDKMDWLKRPDGFRQPFRREIIPLIAWLMNETERRGYDIRGDWSWGYNCREIRGYPGVPSNHSWGLALDINAPTNPMQAGSPGWQWLHDHHRTDMPAWLPPLWKAHGFGWGGDYSHRQDAMHMEVLVSPGDVARITATVLNTTPDKPSPVVYLLDRTLHIGDKGKPGDGKLGDIIVHVQDELRWFSVKYRAADCNPGNSDGNYGPKSGAASRAFKTRMNAFQPKVFHLPADTTFGGTTQATVDFWNAART